MRVIQVARLLTAGLALAGCQSEDDSGLKRLPACGYEIFDAHRVTTTTRHPARDEGNGVVSQITESNGERPFRQLELVDCRAGVNFWTSDKAISDSSDLMQLPSDTAFLQLIDAMRAKGRLSDLQYAGNRLANSQDAAEVQETGRKVIVRLANPSLPSEQLGCACNLYYPGTVKTWVPWSIARDRELFPKTLAEARAMVDAWRAERDLEPSARVNE